jgi:hypothetical protein
MKYIVLATRSKGDRKEVIVSERTTLPSFEQLQDMRNHLSMLSLEYEDGVQLRVEERNS